MTHRSPQGSDHIMAARKAAYERGAHAAATGTLGDIAERDNEGRGMTFTESLDALERRGARDALAALETRDDVVAAAAGAHRTATTRERRAPVWDDADKRGREARTDAWVAANRMATAPDDDPQNQWRTRAAELARLDLEVRRFHAYRDNHPDYIPTEADRRELQDRLDRIDTLTAQERDDMATMVTTSAPGHTSHPSRAEQLRDGRPLTAGDTFTAWTRDRGRAEGRDTGEDLDLERYLRGLVTGDWRDADNERRAMGGTTGALGGYAVPLALSARIIDLARPRTRCLEAGATIVPMATAHVDVATWVEDPTPAWRTEHAAIAVDDAGLGKIRLSARSLAVIVKVSRELLEDATAGGGVENALSNAFAAQAAQSLDYAALFGTGTANNPDAVPGLPTDAPRGIAATTGVAKTSLGTNGATLDWDDLLDAQHELATRNEEATASITAPRTVRDLRKLKDSTGQYLTPPADLPPTLATNLVPVNQTHGTATTATSLIMGDYSQLYLGIRTDLQIIPLRERYADNGQVGFLLWFRGDVAVARPGAFQVVEGIIPA